MVNTEIRLIIFFAPEDGEALYSQKKIRPEADCGSDYQLLMAKSDLTKESGEKPLGHSGLM